MKDKHAHLSGNALLTATAQENVLVPLENLRTHPAVAVGLAKGDLRLHAWVHKLETGEVFAYDPGREQFLPLVESAHSPHAAATFVSLPRLAAALEAVPHDRELHVQFDRLHYIDHACLELLIDREHQTKAAGGSVTLDGKLLEARFHQPGGLGCAGTQG